MAQKFQKTPSLLCPHGKTQIWKNKRSDWPGLSCPSMSAMLPFLTFSMTAPLKPFSRILPPTTLRPRMAALEPPVASLEPLRKIMWPIMRFPSADTCHDSGCWQCKKHTLTTDPRAQSVLIVIVSNRRHREHIKQVIKKTRSGAKGSADDRLGCFSRFIFFISERSAVINSATLSTQVCTLRRLLFNCQPAIAGSWYLSKLHV